MLQIMREHLQGWVANIIIGILAIAFSLWGIQYYLERNGSSNAVAKVNGHEITDQELNSVFERLRANFSLDSNAQAKLKEQALQQIIHEHVLGEGAVKEGYRISPAQLDNVIMQLPVFQHQGQFSPDRFRQVLNSLGYTQEQFLVDLERTLLINQIQMGIVNSAFALPGEARQALQLANQKRDIAYAIIPATKFYGLYKPDPNAIKAYYQQHPDQFQVPEKVTIEYLELSVDQLAKTIAVTTPDAHQYYQDNLANFTKSGKTLPFSQVNAEIEKNLKKQKLQQLFSEQSQKLSDLTYTDPNTLATAAKALNLTVQTAEFTRAGDKTSSIAANPQVLAAAFNEDVLKNGNNSNLISIKDGTVVVLRVKNYQPITIKPLQAVSSQIEQILRQQFAEQQVAQFGNKVSTQIQAGQSLQTATQNKGISWQYKNAVTRQMPGIDMQILRTAFSLEKPTNPAKPSVAAVPLANGDYAVVAVKSVLDSNATPTAQQLHVSQNQLQVNYGQLEYQLWVSDLMKHAKIKLLTPAAR